MSDTNKTLNPQEDMQSVYAESLKSAPPDTVVLFQNTTQLNKADSLFYTCAQVEDEISLQALLDTGSMACTISEEAEQMLKDCGSTSEPISAHPDILLVGCGGVQVRPKCIHNLKMQVCQL